MDWLQRYVDNVKRYLPSNLREDIGSELYSDLQDQCDDLAERLGRPPAEAEVLALLKERGHPMQVAAAYRPRRTLVSEALFPLYLQVLQWVFLAVILGNGAVAVVGLFTQAEPDFLRAALQWLAGTFDAAVYCFAWVTLGFYLAGEGLSFSDAFGKWDPRKLPRIADGGRRISLFDAAVELVVMLVLMGWLNNLFAAVQPAAGAYHFVFGSGLRDLLPWLNLAMALSILMALDKLFAPYWTRAKLVADGAINAYWLFLLAQLFVLEQPFSIHWGESGAQRWAMPMSNWQIIIGIAFAITAYDLLMNVLRYLRTRSAGLTADRCP